MNKTDILIIDDQIDDPDFIEPRVEWLEEAGYNVIKSKTLSNAWKMIVEHVQNSNRKLFILLDIMMPTHNDREWLLETKEIAATDAGLHFCERVQARFPDVKISFHSVRNQDEPDIKKAIEKFDVPLIEKGIQEEDGFIKEVREAIGGEG